MSLTYSLFDIGSANLITWFEDREEARSELEALLLANPNTESEYLLFSADQAGNIIDDWQEAGLWDFVNDRQLGHTTS
jgi:hypothetical protein